MKIVLSAAIVLATAISVDAAPPVERPSLAPYVEQLAAGLECWGNDGASHPSPTRVIYRRGGDWRIGGERIVGQALEQIFDGVDPQLVIYKFCVTRGALAPYRGEGS